MHDGTFIDSLMLCRNFWEHLVVQVCIKSDMSCFKSFLDILSGFSYLIYVHVKLFVIYMRKISLSTLMLISNRRSEVHSFPDSFKCVWWWNLWVFFLIIIGILIFIVIVMFSRVFIQMSQDSDILPVVVHFNVTSIWWWISWYFYHIRTSWIIRGRS